MSKFQNLIREEIKFIQEGSTLQFQSENCYYNNFLMQTKSKLIEKVTKNTRSTRKETTQSKPAQFMLFQTTKLFTEGKNPAKEKMKIQEQRASQHISQENQSIVVNLNLGQYGFDTQIREHICSGIEEILQKLSLFSANPDTLQIQWPNICKQIAEKLINECFLMQRKSCCVFFDQQSEKLIEISRNQYIAWKYMHQLLSRLKKGYKSPGLSGAIMDQTENIRKMLQKSKNIFNSNLLIQKNEDTNHISHQLEVEVAYKTYINGLGDFIIDELNYFLTKQFQESSRLGKLENKIQNWQQWANFIQKKRVRLRKANKFILHTSCQLCLSPYFQLSNPIVNCLQCHTRGHKLCLGGDRTNRCGRCIYLRLSNTVKSQVSQCFICSVKNLVPIRISAQKFVHVFCIISHGLWKIQNSSITLDETKIKKQSESQKCKFCQQKTKFYAKCQNCCQASHYICAYLNGACFSIGQNNLILFECCSMNSVSAERLAYQRKYILNYNSSVFKRLACVLQCLKKNKNKKRGLHKFQNCKEKEDRSQLNSKLNMLSQHYQIDYCYENRLQIQCSDQSIIEQSP